MKLIAVIVGILVSQVAFAANDCSLAVADIHDKVSDIMAAKGFVVVDKSQTLEKEVVQFQRDGDFDGLISRVLEEGQYGITSDSSYSYLMVKKNGAVTLVDRTSASTDELAAKAFKDCKDL